MTGDSLAEKTGRSCLAVKVAPVARTVGLGVKLLVGAVDEDQGLARTCDAVNPALAFSETVRQLLQLENSGCQWSLKTPGKQKTRILTGRVAGLMYVAELLETCSWW